MTEALTRWTANQSRFTRGLLWIIAIIGSVFLVGFFVGFTIAIIKHGGVSHPIRSIVAFVIAAAALAGSILLFKALRSGQPPETAYERRYNRVILTLGGIGGLIGMFLATAKLFGPDEPEKLSIEWLLDPTSLYAIPPFAAVTATVLLLVVLGASFTWYHRIIDDHEERGVLWGSTIGYYFMLFAVPCWLLLAAGGLLPPMTGLVALALIIFSTFVQAGVWAWLKYR